MRKTARRKKCNKQENALKYDYLIVGSGLSGAVFAHEATAHGKSCLVIEKRHHTGGNIFCEVKEGIAIHKYGAHIFHTADKEVWDYVTSLAEFRTYVHSPVANYKGEMYALPFNMNTFSKMWGISRPEEAAEIIAEQKGEVAGDPKNLEEQAISLVGRDIYEKLIKGYTEKQWGRDCRELPPSIIKRIPVRLTYNNNYFNHPYQGMPVGGYNALTEALLQGSEVRLNTDYFEDAEGLKALAKKTVYTGALDRYFDFCLGKLSYRTVSFETEWLDTDNFQGASVVNYTDRETPYTRIIEHRHFDAECSAKRTVISKEYSAEWQEGSEPYYPVTDDANSALAEKYRALAEREENVIFLGRLAQYRYYDMDQAVRVALDAAEREL